MSGPSIHDFLAYGYFVKELPPSISSIDFADKVADAHIAPTTRATRSMPVSIAKAHGVRRQLSIPHPDSQLALVNYCSANFAVIIAKSRSSWSISNVESGQQFPTERSLIVRPGLAERTKRRVRVRRRGTHVVNTDVARFYDSVYTHSLEWVFEGKATSKARVRGGARGVTKGYGSELDRLVRNCQDKQTLGIPTGPDTSLLLGELILSEALRNVPGLTRERAWRYFDDIEVAVQSRSEAEDMLGLIEGALASFNLSLNPAKTSISELPKPYDSMSIADLRLWTPRSVSATKFLHDGLSYLSLAMDLDQRAAKKENLMAYALGALGRQFRQLDLGLWKTTDAARTWNDLGQAIMGLVVTDTSLLPHLDAWLVDGGANGWTMQRSDVGACVEGILKRAAPRGHSSEVAWAVHIAASSRIKSLSKVASAFGRTSDPITQLMALALHQWGMLNNCNLDFVTAVDQEKDSCESENWLVGYQAWRFGTCGGTYFGKDPFFQKLNRLNVEFLRLPPPYCSDPATVRHSARLPSGGPTARAPLPTVSRIVIPTSAASGANVGFDSLPVPIHRIPDHVDRDPWDDFLRIDRRNIDPGHGY